MKPIAGGRRRGGESAAFGRSPLLDVLGDRIGGNALVNPAAHLRGPIFGHGAANVAAGNMLVMGDSMAHVAGVAVIEFAVGTIDPDFVEVFG